MIHNNISHFVILILVLIAPIVLTFLLRHYYPDRRWVGILLSFISIFGQFYRPGAGIYFTALLLIFIIWTAYFGPNIYPLAFVNIISAAIMAYRFMRPSSIPRTPGHGPK